MIERAENLFTALEDLSDQQFQDMIEAEHSIPHSIGHKEIRKQLERLRKEFAAMILEGFPSYTRCE